MVPIFRLKKSIIVSSSRSNSYSSMSLTTIQIESYLVCYVIQFDAFNLCTHFGVSQRLLLLLLVYLVRFLLHSFVHFSIYLPLPLSFPWLFHILLICFNVIFAIVTCCFSIYGTKKRNNRPFFPFVPFHVAFFIEMCIAFCNIAIVYGCSLWTECNRMFHASKLHSIVVDSRKTRCHLCLLHQAQAHTLTACAKETTVWFKERII